MSMYGYKESDHLLAQTMVGYKQLVQKEPEVEKKPNEAGKDKPKEE